MLDIPEPLKNILTSCREKNFVKAIEKAWRLDSTYGMDELRKASIAPDRLVFLACREAIKNTDAIPKALESSVFPIALTSLGKGGKPYRHYMLLAHLKTTEYLLNKRSSFASDVPQEYIDKIKEDLEKAWNKYVGKDKKSKCYEELKNPGNLQDGFDPPAGVPCPLDGFLRDLALQLMPDDKNGSVCNLSKEASQDINVLFVHGNEGVPLTLTLELCKACSSDSKTLYPDPQHAFIYRDPAFLDAEQTAAKLAKGEENLWPERYDVRWRLKRLDGDPLQFILQGNSAGLAFTVGLKKLLLRTKESRGTNDQG